MKYSTKQLTKQGVPGVSYGALAIGRTREPLRERFLIATALTGVLALAYLGTAQAGDFSPESTTMRPLYAVSFDVGRKHVLSYFLSKGRQCDLTVMVTDRPKIAPEGKEIPPLSTTRFKAALDGGKTARVDTGEGRALEYACTMGAQAMSVREVNQLAFGSPSAN